MLWKEAVVFVEVVYSSSNWIASRVYDLGLNFHFTLINVYGPIKIEEKASL